MTPPLALYIHLPWCVRKCPYCDFNSHTAPGTLPEDTYVDALLRDLDQDLEGTGGRELTSVFFGGGTPSLFEPATIERILDGVRARLPLAPDCEVTMEANPGAVEADRFAGFRAAGVNRLSLGVQSLDDAMLRRLGRIHDAERARTAVAAARTAGFDNLNLDMMYALPEQDIAAAMRDLEALLELAPEHVSYYQLTLEPGTPFHHRPPPLPDHDEAWAMHAAAGRRLRAAGYRQYEVSAWARPGRACRHNGNYWRFGDYLGIGAGAHGKLTMANGRIVRRAKQHLPNRYMAAAGGAGGIADERVLDDVDRRFEFLMNALRLTGGFDVALYTERTGLPAAELDDLAAAHPRLLRLRRGKLRCTDLGRRHLDTLLADLLPEVV